MGNAVGVESYIGQQPAIRHGKKRRFLIRLRRNNQNVALVFSHDGKGDFVGEALIDDGPHNIELFRKKNPGAIITGIEHPYNQCARQHASFLAEDWQKPEEAWRHMASVIIGALS